MEKATFDSRLPASVHRKTGVSSARRALSGGGDAITANHLPSYAAWRCLVSTGYKARSHLDLGLDELL
jgi:hypothetical protein